MSERPEDREKLSRSERIALRVSIIQTFLAVTGFFVGCVALYAALTESDAVRKQQQASVWPRLQLSRSFYGMPGQERLDIVVGNRGIGPARVATASVTAKGETAKTWIEVARKYSGVDQIGISDDTIANKVIAPAEDITVFSIEERFSDSATVRALRRAFDSGEIRVDICYCSVFDACWKVSSVSPREEPTNKCPVLADDVKF